MTGILVSPDGPVGWATEWAAANDGVVFATEGGVPARGDAPLYSAADAFGWPGGLVATCPETLGVMDRLPRRGPRGLWLEDANGLAAGWQFRDLRAALEGVAVSFATADAARLFTLTWGLPADVGR